MDWLRYHARPALRRPVMVVAMRGMYDASEAATSAAEFLKTSWKTSPYASIDPEEFFDFQVVRPTVVLVDGVTREIMWPVTEFTSASVADQSRDVALLTGTEPSMRWRTFCQTVLAVVKEAEVELVVTLGALSAAVPHSRPIRVMGTTTTPGLAEQLGLTVSRYQGPTGILTVLTDFCRQAGVDAASLWAWMPHYVTASPSPKGALALIRRLESLAEIEADTAELERQVPDYDERVAKAVSSDPEVAQYVRTLERTADEQVQRQEAEQTALQNLPSGDDLAREFERFLREQRDDPGSN